MQVHTKGKRLRRMTSHWVKSQAQTLEEARPLRDLKQIKEL